MFFTYKCNEQQFVLRSEESLRNRKRQRIRQSRKNREKNRVAVFWSSNAFYRLFQQLSACFSNRLCGVSATVCQILKHESVLKKNRVWSF